MNVEKLVDGILEECEELTIDMMGKGSDQGEYVYLRGHEKTFVRTVEDVVELLGKEAKTVLEIGSLLGTVSIALKRSGYDVYALDIPEFFQSANLRKLYEKNGIPFVGFNLKHGKLPYDDAFFDAVVMCDVLEHLNFNPLPAILEINRVLKPGGLIYINTPNQTRFEKRTKMLFGCSVHNPIDDFFLQLTENSNMVVGLHWREYTMKEVVEMIEKLGFRKLRVCYFWDGSKSPNAVKSMLQVVFHNLPFLRPSLIVAGKKIKPPEHSFWLTEAY